MRATARTREHDVRGSIDEMHARAYLEESVSGTSSAEYLQRD